MKYSKDLNSFIFLGEMMDLYVIAHSCCITIPIILLSLSAIAIYISYSNNKKINSILYVLFIVCLLILSLIIYSFYVYQIKNDPYNGRYSYEVYIQYNSGNGSNYVIDLPLPHDSRIYSEIEFYRSYEEKLEYCYDDENRYIFDHKTQYLSHHIYDSINGKVLHIESNNSIFIYSHYSDSENEINPNLKLTTQKKDMANIKTSIMNDTEISLILNYEHTWGVGIFLSFDSKTQYLSISKYPFELPDDFPDTSRYNHDDVFEEEGVKLSNGWSQLKITSDEYIVRD
jgi:hypothetical protein